MNIITGYYGYIHPNGRTYTTAVHVIGYNEGPLCGVKRQDRWEYQMCANYLVPNYISCKKCKEIVECL